MIIHVSTVHPRGDTRIYLKQLKSIAKNFPLKEILFLVADGQGNSRENNLSIVDLGLPKSRFTRMLFKSIAAYKYITNTSSDLVQIHDPELLLIAYLLSKKGKIVVYDAHEDYRLDILSRDWIPVFIRRLVAKYLGKFEDFVVQQIAGTISATPSIHKRLKSKSPKSIVINNYPILSEFSANNLKVIDSFKDQISFCYIGAIAHERGLTQVIQSLSFFQSKVILELGGSFSDKKYESYLKTLPEWEYVNYRGQLNRNEMNEVFSRSLFGIATYLPTDSHLYAQPNKLFEYLSAGLPIICSHFNYWRDLFCNKDCAFFVDPEDPKSIIEGINFFSQDIKHTINMGENGRSIVQKSFSWSAEEKKLVNFYNELI